MKKPAKSPPAGAVKVFEPFILPKSTDRPVLLTDQAGVEAQHDGPSAVISHQPTDQPSTDQTPVALSQFPGPSGLHST